MNDDVKGFIPADQEVVNHIPVLAAVTLAAKKDLSSLPYKKILKCYEDEIETLQNAAMHIPMYSKYVETD